MATVVGRTLVGLTAFSRDETKLGKIKEVIGDGTSTREYVVIGRRFGADRIIPAHVVEASGDRAVVPRSSSFIDCAPAVKAKGGLSPEDGDRLDEFYSVHGAQV